MLSAIALQGWNEHHVILTDDVEGPAQRHRLRQSGESKSPSLRPGRLGTFMCCIMQSHHGYKNGRTNSQFVCLQLLQDAVTSSS